MENERRRIFVFGSNIAGRHGKGAALHAKTHYGAINGKGWGLHGNSFAIPITDYRGSPLPDKSIRVYIEEFVKFAKSSPDLELDLGGLDEEHQQLAIGMGFKND